MNPVRIQRKRTPGWKMPQNTVNVGRPSIWGNPFKIGEPLIINAQIAVEAYEHYMKVSPSGQMLAKMAKIDLRGKNLACWCKPGQPCHADVLLKIANEG